MPVTVIVGAQWGDEGKGRMIDLLADAADCVVRFQGGSNAGHTLFDAKGNKVVLHQIPSGILWDDKLCVIGNGVVVDPLKLVDEIHNLKALGYLKHEAQLAISHACHMVLPYHKELDLLDEKSRGNDKIGTTGKGIGPAYGDKVGRSGLRLCDLMDAAGFADKLAPILQRKNLLLQKLYGHPGFELQTITQPYLEAGKILAPYVQEVPPLLYDKLNQGSRVLCEGAQGSELDVDHGTYPFVTSSNTLAAAALLGAGIAPRHLGRIIGIVKAYSTRVGSGPFPTQDDGPNGELLCSKGHEFGSTTGRKRRCGWLDLMQLKHAVMMNGLTSLIITKLDILNGFKEVPLCVGYRYKGKVLAHFPTQSDVLAKVEPIYETMPGWQIDGQMPTQFAQLPQAAKNYLKRIEDILNCPIDLISLGPKRENFLNPHGHNFSAFSS